VLTPSGKVNLKKNHFLLGLSSEVTTEHYTKNYHHCTSSNHSRRTGVDQKQHQFLIRSLQQHRNISTFVFKEEDEEETDSDDEIMTDIYKTNDLIFNLTAEEIQKQTEELLRRSKEVNDKVGALPESERTFESVILPLAHDEAAFSTYENIVTFPSYISPIKEVRDAGSAAEEKISEFTIEILMREDVYKAIKAVSEKMEKEQGKYDAEDKRLVKRLLRDYERNGLGLPEDKRSQVKELKNQISKMCIQFTKNIAEDKTVLQFTREELAGVPQDVIDGFKTSEEDPNKKIVSLKYPEVMPVMKYCKVEETRRQLERARSSQCQDINVPIFEQIVKLRQKTAELMGYKTHGDYVLEVNMAKREEVIFFLNNLKSKLLEGGKQEMEVLKDLKGAEVFSWDYLYLLTKLKEEKYSVDDNLIKEYFPLEKALNGILGIAQDTFSLRFEEVKEPANGVWFEGVQLFAVFDKESDKFLGQFYLDLYPRDGKYTHFAAFPLSPHYFDSEGKEHFPVSAMVCNFTKPSQETGVSLLKHDEVVTLAHEFGHLMHGFLSKTKYARFSGTRVERDFVEMPSQFMENYCWEVESLKRLSSHHKTGEPLPDELIKKMIDAKNVGVALFNLRQLFFGIFDATCHSFSSAQELEGFNSGELWRSLRREVTLLESPEGTNGVASFGHIVGGYDFGRMVFSIHKLVKNIEILFLRVAVQEMAVTCSGNS